LLTPDESKATLLSSRRAWSRTRRAGPVRRIASVLALRRQRERTERRRLIVTTARAIAEAEGWAAVTTRRLAEAIEYSQPLIYSHFASMIEISDAVAVQGFAELTRSLHSASAASAGPAEGLSALAHRYLDFAHSAPATYSAMFSRDTTLTFAAPDSPEPLRAGFGALADVMRAATGEHDLDTRTELFWSSLHGLATLTSGHRLRADAADDRIRLLVEQVTGAAVSQ
jgi:AcrR family transcriptional regulator